MIYKAIASYMQENGIKQAYLSEKTGIAPQGVSAFLKGKRRLEVEEYAKICTALDVPYDFFFPSRAS